MNTWIHSLLQELEEKLCHATAYQALQACRETNACLSGYMEQYVFQSRKEEVLYFKIFKPRFMAHQLKYEILVSGENMDRNAVASWLRDYYQNDNTRADGFHFTYRSCRKCDFELPVKTAAAPGWETADKLVARLLVEEWLQAENKLFMRHA